MRFFRGLAIFLLILLAIVTNAIFAQDQETESIKSSHPTVQAVYDAFNTQDLSNIPGLITPDFELHINMMTNPLGSGEASQLGWIGWVTSLSPDWNLNIVGEAVDGDMIYTQWVGFGTHSGEAPSLMDGTMILPTGNDMYLEGAAIFRMDGDLIAEQWIYFDNFYVSVATGQITLPSG